MLCFILIKKTKKTKKKEKIGKKDFFTCWALAYSCIKFKSDFYLNPPSLARAVFNPNKKSKKIRKKEKRENIKKRKREKSFSPAVH